METGPVLRADSDAQIMMTDLQPRGPHEASAEKSGRINKCTIVFGSVFGGKADIDVNDLASAFDPCRKSAVSLVT